MRGGAGMEAGTRERTSTPLALAAPASLVHAGPALPFAPRPRSRFRDGVDRRQVEPHEYLCCPIGQRLGLGVRYVGLEGSILLAAPWETRCCNPLPLTTGYCFFSSFQCSTLV